MDQDSASAPTSDSTLEQIHNMSKEKETDPTREQIRKYSNFSVSEALGLPLLTGDKPTGSWLGMTTTPKSANPQTTGPTVSLFGNAGASYFYWLTDTDRKAIYVGAAVILLPLLGGFLFSR